MDERTKDFYKKYPDRFVEDFLGLKLHQYQKVMLRMLLVKNKIKKEIKS